MRIIVLLKHIVCIISNSRYFRDPKNGLNENHLNISYSLYGQPLESKIREFSENKIQPKIIVI